MPLDNALTSAQWQAITITERVNSAISIASIAFIALTYLTTPCFNKPINRLIFFAGFGNLGTCIAALIADIGPLSGPDSPVCQAQAFFVQMFLGVDGLWAFCMAINVYLAFFRGFSVEQFKRLDMWYLLFCYGLSFLPALIFVFVSATDRGRVYGPATIWCWISERWNSLRFAFLYAWIWLAIGFALAIYIRAGIVIYQRRRQLSGFLNPLNENPFKAVVTTEVHVTSEPLGEEGISSLPAPAVAALPFSDPRPQAQYQADVDVATDYTSNTSDKTVRYPDLPALLQVRSYTRQVAQDSVNPEAWLYARVAFLFYIALIITWIPSSINRIYSLARPGEVSFALSYMASFLFPLQAFWNLVVYVITSRRACENLMRRWFFGGRGIRETEIMIREDGTQVMKKRMERIERLGSEDPIVW
ncbi:MMS19 nucleotide excision repair [Sphaceloma murrayae]|uniref:MMS19 nucleotide excision repair n=1 Tax=Sphaceloma murrayae TaxID=2082308 RepID=A0A2K1R2T4_9PEZI|nr:MMS19 nucleotide excision repair [Sphaceloma murrayae]